jgi:hypothetical protein
MSKLWDHFKDESKPSMQTEVPGLAQGDVMSLKISTSIEKHWQNQPESEQAMHAWVSSFSAYDQKFCHVPARFICNAVAASNVIT